MNYPVKIEIPVAWGEMDAYQHVNNVVYFRYMESARIAFFRALEGDHFGTGDFAPILARTECDFRRPVFFPDTVSVETGVSRLGGSSFTMEYRISSQVLGEIVAEGKAVVVNFDAGSGKSRPLSESLRNRLKELQG